MIPCKYSSFCLSFNFPTNLFQFLRSTGSYTIEILNNLLAVELTQDVDVEQEPLVTLSSYFIMVPEVLILRKNMINFLCGGL